MEERSVKGNVLLKGLKALRTAKSLSQAELAEMLGVSSRQVGRWESGDSEPLASLIPKICQVLGCSLDQLWGVCDAA